MKSRRPRALGPRLPASLPGWLLLICLFLPLHSIVAQEIDLYDALENDAYAWGNGGNANWFGQLATTHDGVDAAQSGDISDIQSSWLEQSAVTGPGTLTFWWKVSSEPGWDFLRFDLNGAQQASAPEISGEVAWQQKTVIIPAGSHTLRWTYYKDESVSEGSDAGWLDEVTFIPGDPTGAVVRFDATALPLADNTAVTTWGGQTAGGTPTFHNSQTPSGKPAVLFDGSDRMGDNVTVPASAAQDWIVAAVIKPDNTGGHHNIVDDDAQVTPMLWVRNTFQYEMNFGAGGNSAAGTGTQGWDIIIADSRLNQVYVNSPTPNANGNHAAAYLNPLPFDFFHRDGAQTFSGRVAELRLYNDRAAFGGDFTALYNELRAKWIDTTPIAHWVADDWAGGTANWVDRVSGRIATVAAATNSPAKTPGAIFGPHNGSGIVFDGLNDYFSVAAAENPIVGKNSVTIAALFKTTRGASGADGDYWRYPGPLNAESPGWPNDWALTCDAAGNAHGLFNFEIVPQPAISLIDGRTHSMILTWQDPTAAPGQGMARLYVDGVLAGSTGIEDGGDGIVNDGFVIGTEKELLARYFSGAIGELRFYDTVIDAAALHSQLTSLTGYAQWASTMLPPGLNGAFDGYSYGNGLSNGVAYALSRNPALGWNPIFQVPSGIYGQAPYTAIPEDVDLYLDRSLTLAAGSWTTVGSWVNGADPVFADGVGRTLLDVGFELPITVIEDTFAGPKAYYRYRAVKR